MSEFEPPDSIIEIFGENDSLYTVVEYNLDGMFFAAGTTKGTVELWNTLCLSCINSIPCYSTWVSALAYALYVMIIINRWRTNDILITGSNNGDINVWNLLTNSSIYHLSYTAIPICIEVNPITQASILIGYKDHHTELISYTFSSNKAIYNNTKDNSDIVIYGSFLNNGNIILVMDNNDFIFYDPTGEYINRYISSPSAPSPSNSPNDSNSKVNQQSKLLSATMSINNQNLVTLCNEFHHIIKLYSIINFDNVKLLCKFNPENRSVFDRISLSPTSEYIIARIIIIIYLYRN